MNNNQQIIQYRQLGFSELVHDVELASHNLYQRKQTKDRNDLDQEILSLHGLSLAVLNQQESNVNSFRWAAIGFLLYYDRFCKEQGLNFD